MRNRQREEKKDGVVEIECKRGKEKKERKKEKNH